MDKKDNKKKLWEITIALLAGVIFVTALFIINNITESDNKTIANTQSTTATQKATEKTTAATTQKTTQDTYDKLTKYKAGTYKVGKDIPSGDYYLQSLTSKGSAYFGVYADSNKTKINFNENFKGNMLINIEDGEYLELNKCNAIPLLEFRQYYTTKTTLDNCMLEVGIDIEPGEYKLIATSSRGYYCIYDDLRQSRIVSNDNFDNQTYCTVKKGQFLMLNNCKIEQ